MTIEEFEKDHQELITAMKNDMGYYFYKLSEHLCFNEALQEYTKIIAETCKDFLRIEVKFSVIPIEKNKSFLDEMIDNIQSFLLDLSKEDTPLSPKAAKDIINKHRAITDEYFGRFLKIRMEEIERETEE